MLSPGDQVFLDGDHDLAHRWTVTNASRREEKNFYTLRNKDDEVILDCPPSRITAQWFEA